MMLPLTVYFTAALYTFIPLSGFAHDGRVASWSPTEELQAKKVKVMFLDDCYNTKVCTLMKSSIHVVS